MFFPRTHGEEFLWRSVFVGQELLGSEMHRSLVSLHMQRFSIVPHLSNACFAADASSGFNLHFPNCTWEVSIFHAYVGLFAVSHSVKCLPFLFPLFPLLGVFAFFSLCSIKFSQFQKGQNSTEFLCIHPDYQHFTMLFLLQSQNSA